jgi:Tfp pilus assembly protein PilW
MSSSGFSLAEAMVSAALGAFVLGAALDVFVTQHHHYRGQQARAELQQDLRGGMRLLASELRLAGAGALVGHSPLSVMATDEVAFDANVNDVRGALVARAVSGQDWLEIRPGAGWAKGKRVVICDPTGCEEHVLAKDGPSGKLVLSSCLTRDFAVGSRVEVVNRVRYYLSRSDPQNHKIVREVDRGANPLIEHVEDFSLTYLGESGAPAVTSAAVRLVHVRVETGGSDSRGGRIRRFHTQDVGVRAI